jgi:hypothetical protein
MKHLAKNLIAGTAIAILSLTATFAADSTEAGSQIINGQVNLNNVTSTMTTTIDAVGGDVTVSSAAAANVLDVTTMNDTTVTSDQYASASEIGSYLGASVNNVTGSVSISGQAVCNSAAVSSDPTLTKVTNTQQCNAIDPSSTVYADVSNIGGSVTIANTAVGNTFEADSNATSMPITNTQTNNSAVTATTTAHVSSVGGAVSVSASAVGNSAQIVHYSTN